MRISIALIYLCLSISAFSQVNFFKGENWNAVLVKAKTENKHIFVDCYTTWCGPCKFMDKETFSDSAIGVIMNEKFVSFKLQLDQTKNDDSYTKSWSKFGKEFDLKYKISSYPSYLVFNSSGEIVDRTGGFQTPQKFIKTIELLLNPEEQYYTLLKKMENQTLTDLEFKKLYEKVEKVHDNTLLAKLSRAYLSKQEVWLTHENIKYLFNTQPVEGDAYFDTIITNRTKIKTIDRRSTSDEMIYSSLYTKYISKNTKPDWNGIDTAFAKYMGHLSAYSSNKARIRYAMKQKDNTSVVKEVNLGLATMKDIIPFHILTEYASFIADNSTNKNELIQALGWMKTSNYFSSSHYMEIEVNILEKLGRNEEAEIIKVKAKEKKLEEDLMEEKIRKLMKLNK